MANLNPGIKIIKKSELCYLVKIFNSLLKFRLWKGDSFSFFYDFIMSHFIFPTKFSSDISKHYDPLSHKLAAISGRQIFELETGRGSQSVSLKGIISMLDTGTD